MPGPRSVHSIQPSGPPSPTLSATTRASLDFPSRPSILITRADLRNSLNAYEKLLGSAKAYTNAMLTMAKASSDLACALEECARVKGAHNSGPGLQAASGLHFLKSNYEQLLCDTFWKDFSIPLLSHYDTYRAACHDRQLAHDKAISEKSKQLKEAEARNIRTGRKKERDLNSFRRALAELQAHVDSLDELKAHYYHEVLESEQEMWDFIHSKVSLIVRSQIDISERISSKGLSDPILEPMLATIPDPFGSYGPPKQDDQIFSILPPTSLMSSASNSSHGGIVGGDYANGTPTANPSAGAILNATISPVNLMSPSTPSTGLPRNSQALAAATAGTRSPNRDASHLLSGLSGSKGLDLAAISQVSASVSASVSSATTNLFGSGSMDFEEILERDQQRKRAAALVSSKDAQPNPFEASDPESPTPNGSTAVGRLRHTLSIIVEDIPNIVSEQSPVSVEQDLDADGESQAATFASEEGEQVKQDSATSTLEPVSVVQEQEVQTTAQRDTSHEQAQETEDKANQVDQEPQEALPHCSYASMGRIDEREQVKQPWPAVGMEDVKREEGDDPLEN